jgi:ATP-dependent RNA helicase HrpB
VGETALAPLPIDPFIPEIVDRVRRSRAVVVTAAPGAGKTTRVPPALVGDGAVILLQPRRVAARAIASRIAAERGWTLGREVGWQIRFERRFSADTKLLVVTEGVLTARLQTDPLLSDFHTIVLDEFHERSIHADVAIALARQAWRARDEARIVVMSATLDAGAVSAFLDNCPIVEAPGRLHPIDVTYTPGQPVADAAADALDATSGQVLCFLPGAPEIRRAMGDLQSRLGGRGAEIVPLHGSLDAVEQDAALAVSSRRRIVVATNIAETSLTVPGVTAVVDSGLHKVARYDADRGIDSLETERITADAADQRAGRAGRVAPGIVRRLWDARDRLRPHREPDIHRVDLSSAVLDVIAWGGDPRTLEWFEPPRRDAIDAALALLTRLGVIRDGRLTTVGEHVRRLPLHPRLARMLVAAGGAREVAQACALLSERHLLPPRHASTSSDLL